MVTLDRREPSRVVVESVTPSVDDGRFPAKAIVNEIVVVEADVFADGRDACRALLRYRPQGGAWAEAEMLPLGNDRFRGSFVGVALGSYEFEVVGSIDHFATMLRDLAVREQIGEDVANERAELVAYAAATRRAFRSARSDLEALLSRLAKAPAPSLEELPAEVVATVARRGPRSSGTASRRYGVVVERERARYSNWYELFPRSAGKGLEHGTLADVVGRLDYVQRLGANVLYLPPIHPIGETNRKGPNNARQAAPGDPGSPWAIGGERGGHTAIHPELGDLTDFDNLVGAAAERGIEVALDLALQCSPDHPWVREHPAWFRHRADGTIAYAENPPKRYEDVYPLDFETEEWRELWTACLGIVEFWIAHGVRIFRVDNPHTKPLRFWEWLIDSVRRKHPDVVFLSEAFTRPKVMYHLAKLGFSQSYTYFAWRTGRQELEDYVRELTSAPVRDFFRPSFWPNTPDILTEQLQHGGRPAFALRALLAATLSASWGIYGPLFELGVSAVREPGSEEYLDSDKYQVRDDDLDAPDSIAPLIATLNALRAAIPCLQRNDGVAFHRSSNDGLLVYSKRVPNAGPAVLVVANLDVGYRQSGWVELDLGALGLTDGEDFTVTDGLTGMAYAWRGRSNFVILDPATQPGHVFVVEAGPAR